MSHPTLAERTTSSPTTFERAAYVAAGVLLVLPILQRRSWLRYGAAASGGVLIYNGICGDVSAAHHLASRELPSNGIVSRSITIGRDAVDLSSMWSRPEVISRVVKPFGEIEILGTDHIRWTLPVPGNKAKVECTLADNQPGKLVRWKSLPNTGLQVDEHARFRPAPDGRGTEVTLTYEVDFSGTPVAASTLRPMASFFKGPALMAMSKVLHNFKSLAETGEIPTLERNPSARNHGKSNGDLI